MELSAVMFSSGTDSISLSLASPSPVKQEQEPVRYCMSVRIISSISDLYQIRFRFRCEPYVRNALECARIVSKTLQT